MLHARFMLICVIGFGSLLLAGCGPRMRVHPSVQPYERQMPDMPAGTVPTQGTLETFTAQQADKPVPTSAQGASVGDGRLYYGYYCVQCHGVKGDGMGEVGQGYVPKPTDLTSPRVAQLPDRELYRRMLYGVGHSPVMDETVLPEHRWPLVAYVKAFATRGQTAVR